MAWTFAAGAATMVQAQPTGWQTPVDAHITGCYQGIARAALMDDGTLLVACTGQPANYEARYAALWMRTPEGRWQVAAQPPTRGSRASDLRKVSGSQALVSWTDFVEPPAFPVLRLQTWSTGTGAAPAFSIPLPPGVPHQQPPLAETWNTDGLIARERPARKEDLPGAPDAAVGQAVVVELVNRDGVVAATVPNPPNRFVISGIAGCSFPNGGRLLVFRSKLLSGFAGNAPGKQEPMLHAVVHRAPGGFGATEDVLRTLGPWSLPSAHCAADGVARVVDRIGPDAFSYADLAGERGWQPRQSLSSTGTTSTPPAGEPNAAYLQMARSGDGRALMAWSDTLGPRLIPRVHSLARGDRHFTSDFSMPRYDPDATDNSVGLTALAWNPARQRFMGVLLRYPTTPAARRMAVEFDPAGATWSEPIPLPPALLEGWQIDFNASGRGVLLGRRHGQLLISDWR